MNSTKIIRIVLTFRLCEYSAEERALALKAVNVDVQQRTGTGTRGHSTSRLARANHDMKDRDRKLRRRVATFEARQRYIANSVA